MLYVVKACVFLVGSRKILGVKKIPENNPPEIKLRYPKFALQLELAKLAEVLPGLHYFKFCNRCIAKSSLTLYTYVVFG